MKIAERFTPVGAVLSVLATLACCMPIGFAASIGAASVGAVIAPLRWWLVGLSFVLLGVGFVQTYRRGASCDRRNTWSKVILWTSAAAVALMLATPQLLPSVAADWLDSGGAAATDGRSITDLTPRALDGFKAEFNRASDRTRVVLLLSPT